MWFSDHDWFPLTCWAPLWMMDISWKSSTLDDDFHSNFSSFLSPIGFRPCPYFLSHLFTWMPQEKGLDFLVRKFPFGGAHHTCRLNCPIVGPLAYYQPMKVKPFPLDDLIHHFFKLSSYQRPLTPPPVYLN